MHPEDYSSSLVFPGHSNFHPIFFWLRHPIYTRAVAPAQDLVVCPVKVALEVTEVKKTRCELKSSPLSPTVCTQNQETGLCYNCKSLLGCFVFTCCMGIICTSSFHVWKNQENGSIKKEHFVWGEQEEELVRFQLRVLKPFLLFTFSFRARKKWKPSERCKILPAELFALIIYYIFSLHLHSIKPFSLETDHKISSRVRQAK